MACYSEVSNTLSNNLFKNAIIKFLNNNINGKMKLDDLRYYTDILKTENVDYSKDINIKTKKKYIDKCLERILNFQ